MMSKTLWRVRALNKRKEKVTFRISADGWTEVNILKTLHEVHPELSGITLEDIFEESVEETSEETAEEDSLRRAS